MQPAERPTHPQLANHPDNRVAPLNVEALLHSANEHQKRGQLAEAQMVLSRALAAAPSDCGVLQAMGLLCHQQGNLPAAIDFLQRSVAASPGAEQARYHNNLAMALGRAGRVDDALAAVDRALALRPDYAEAWCNRGVALEKSGRVDDAIAAFRRASDTGTAPDPWVNLAGILSRGNRHAEALEVLTRAAADFPNSPEVAVHFGNALRRAGRLDEAITALRGAVERRPAFPVAHNNLGVALHDAGSFDAAEASLRKAIELRPDYPDPHWNLSLLLLHRGDYHGGWLEYEWRRHLREDGHSRRRFPQPPWSGGPLVGRRVLVICEQGLGDTLQFVRFAAVLAQRGAEVILECQPRLANLMRLVDGVTRVVARGEPLPPFDCHVRLMSIPGILGVTLDSIPSDGPYIHTDPAATADWCRRLDALVPRSGMRVGICWQGNPAYRGDPTRSIPLAAFAPLTQIAGVRLVSLQKGIGTEQAVEFATAGHLLQFAPALDEVAGAFFDTAAVMQNLDLVVTSDTSIAHLAGALGVPTWVCLPLTCDWRWGREGSKTPWYPTVRLFRQHRSGDWTETFDRLAPALDELARARSVSKRPEDGTATPSGVPASSAPILAPVSAGELLDKLSILRLRVAHVTDPQKLGNIHRELTALESVRAATLSDAVITELEAELDRVNATLWATEDALRDCERRQEFGAEFIALARSVYRHNDARSEVKRLINLHVGSAIVEEKSYAPSR